MTLFVEGNSIESLTMIYNRKIIKELGPGKFKSVFPAACFRIEYSTDICRRSFLKQSGIFPYYGPKYTDSVEAVRSGPLAHM